MQRQSTAMTESRAGLIRSSRAFESAKRNASGVLFEPCPPSGGTCGSGFRSSGPADLRLGRGGGRSGTCPSAGRTFRFAKEKPHHNNNNHWQHRYEERDDVLAGRREKSYRFNGSEYNQNVNGSTEHLFSNKSLIESATPLKSLRTILKQFDIIEKRQWPNFLHDLTLLFRKPAFVKVASEKTHRIVDDCTRIFCRILTTKLFPDITDGMVNCLSALSVALKFGCKELFNWMFSFYEQSSDETKHVLLKALVRIIQNKSKGVSEHIASLMSKLKMALEETDSRILLLELTEIFMVISKSYPTVFQANFYDVVDILIAWHLDSALDPTLVHKLTQAFVSFQKFWTNDLTSSQSLLRNFIEDFELNIEQFHNLQSLKSARSDPSPILMRMAALVEVYVTVFRSLGPDAATTATNVISWDFVMNSLLTVLSTVTFILKNHQMHEHLAIACNDCTIFTIEQVELFGEEGMDFILDSKDNILQYLDCLTPHLPKGSVQFVVTTLKLQIILVKSLSGNLPVEFVTKIMSNTQSLRLMPSEEIHSSLYDLHHAMLSVKTLPLLQEAYRGLLSDLQDAMTVLTGEGISLSDSTQALSQAADPKSRMTSRTAMIVAKSTLISLTELGNARGSLIGMWALKPTFFDLILDHMNPSSSSMSKFADLQFMILTMLISHSRKHHHFITSSSILKSTVKSATFTSMIEAPTSGHLSRILMLLSAVLKREKICHQNRLICLKWVTEILSEAGATNVPLLIRKAEMVQLLEIVSTQSYAKNADIALTSCAVLKLLMQSVTLSQLPAAIRQTYFDACLFQAINFDQKVKAGFEEVLPYLGYKCAARHELNLVVFNRDEMFYPEDVFMAKLSLMKREQNNSFSAVSFQRIMSFILNGSGDESLAWLQRILRSSINDEAPLKQPTLMFKTQGRFQSLFGSEQNIVKVFESNESALMFWATWEVVSYCIANKLKTPLGKAQDLLTKIGLTFQQLSVDHCDLPLKLVQVKMLLILMENLDKQIHNAIHGSGFRIGAVSKVAKTFFCTNKATCYDWLARTRLSVMQTAAKACEPELVWRNGIEMIRELMIRKSYGDIESYLFLIVEALIQLKDRDSIIGLMMWAKKELALPCLWMKAAIKEASGRFEVAANAYEAVLREKRAESPIEKSKIADFASRRVMDSYLSVGCYEEASSWSRKTCSPDLASKVEACTLTEPADWSEMNVQPYDMRRVFHSSLQRLLHAVQTGPGANENADDKFKLATDVRDCLKMTLACGSDFKLNRWLILNRVAENVCGPQTRDRPLDLASGLSGELDTSEQTQLLKFCKSGSDFTLNSHVDHILCAIETARKSENLNRASKLMLELCGAGTSPLPTPRDLSPLTHALHNITDSGTNDLSAVDQLKIVREGCELIRSFGDTKTAADVMLSNLTVFSQREAGEELKVAQSDCLITLAKHVESDPKSVETAEQKAAIHSLIDGSLIPAADKMITGRLLDKSCRLNPKSTTAKLLFGNWAFAAGKQVDPEDQADSNSNEETNGLNWFRMAAQSFFSYLEAKANAADDTNVAVTLKLLRIITKHSADNEQLLTDGVRQTPTAPWRNITIQLFAHLTHSQDDFVKKLLSELLCRIGQETPHLVVFPAVSGSLTDDGSRLIAGIDAKVTHPDGDGLSNPEDPDSLPISDEYELSGKELTARSSAFSDVVEVLSSYNSQLIRETVQFIREMRRIAVLWDELWTGTLLSRMSEVKKKSAALEEELLRMNNTNSNLKKKDRIRFMKDKYDSSFQRIIEKLSEIKALTVDAYPETPYEKWFQSTFGKVITSTIISLKNPDDYENPQHAFVLFQQLLQSIQKRSLELATSKSQLVMDTISPTLSSFAGTVIPVPGVKSNEVTISKISKTVTILHTKTKPKKVCFYGSSGESHYFLFKGHEDLHLDERIMQFLEIVNKMFVKRGNRMDAEVFKARYYSVTPLGSKSGLIEWVDGGPPLFGFYKRWLLNRPAAAAVSTKLLANNENACKPSEIFAFKLQENGLNPENRSSWPKDVLMRIHNDLSGETCDQLISRELWFSSTSAQDYYRLTKAFTRSNAVMAMIGYVLGLGDRHLDNILLDLSTGEIIHVDYNICFEKGKTLHVPEKVPCRLTKSIVSAFGLTGVDGTFRLSCEHVLSTLRKEKDTLLLLLEAFVCDPLVEWNSITFDAETKKNMAGLNPYAFKVWRKIKHKFEGRDPDPFRRMSVPEQVDYVIKQATDIENLSLMFEGWTSWV